MLTAGVIWAALGGEPKQAPAEHEKNPVVVKGGVLRVSEEARRKSGLLVEPLKIAPFTRSARGFGSVVDPGPLALLATELQDAESALQLARAQVQRATTLFQQEETVSRRAVETAEAQARTEQTRRDLARNHLAFEWGMNFTNENSMSHAPLLKSVLSRQTALVRGELPLGQSLEFLDSARVRRVGRDAWIPAVFTGITPPVDPRTQGESFLLRVDQPPASLAVGAAVEVELSGTRSEQEQGWLLPSQAILRHLGHNWIYLENAEGEFSRREVSLDRQTGESWLTKSKMPEGAKCVTRGAAELLSAELLLAAGEGEAE